MVILKTWASCALLMVLTQIEVIEPTDSDYSETALPDDSSSDHAPSADEAADAATEIETDLVQDAEFGHAPKVVEAPPIERLSPVTLPAKTPVFVMLDKELSTEVNEIGDSFSVTVLRDVLEGDTVVIPQGTKGYGDVTFVTGNGGFGKAGIIGISLRYLDLDGEWFLLDGRYREEGNSKNGAAVATWIAVGVFSGFIRGKDGAIPQGRELKARTGEDIIYYPLNEDTPSDAVEEPLNEPLVVSKAVPEGILTEDIGGISQSENETSSEPINETSPVITHDLEQN